MSDPIVVPSARDVRATLDEATSETPACVVACPPHPQQRGHRGDQRLVAISDHLTENGVDCLRFDYGDWDEGYGELGDAYAALAWADERYDRVGLTGFSFGACISLLAAGGTGVDEGATGDGRPGVDGGATGDGRPGDDGTPKERPDIEAVAALAPPERLNDDLVATTAMDRVKVPAQVAYGSRDDLADWEPVIEKARELGWAVEEFSADHFFVGREGVVGESLGRFLVASL